MPYICSLIQYLGECHVCCVTNSRGTFCIALLAFWELSPVSYSSLILSKHSLLFLCISHLFMVLSECHSGNEFSYLGQFILEVPMFIHQGFYERNS